MTEWHAMIGQYPENNQTGQFASISQLVISVIILNICDRNAHVFHNPPFCSSVNGLDDRFRAEKVA
jgi:hypothetical protein